MIPRAAIDAWAADHPWPTLAMVEQDLVLARLIVEFAQHPLLGNELVFRGGTCVHQLVLPRPLRYSEDLDFVRTTHSGIGPALDAIREVAASVGLEVAGTTIGQHPKVRLRAGAETDPSASLRVKVEINTHETSPALPLVRLPFQVVSDWFAGDAEVLTFAPPELFATKIRALYQRRKGRDLFDLWLALTDLGVPGRDIVNAFEPYRPDGLSAALAEANLRAKLIRHVMRDTLPDEASLVTPYDGPQRSLVVHETAFRVPVDLDLAALGAITQLGGVIAADDSRNRQIAEDIRAALAQGRKCLVLSRRRDHLTALAALLPGADPLLMRGGTGAKALAAIREKIADAGPNDPLLVLTTVPYGGEGFDAPVIDTVFLVGPISYPGLLIQAVGRALRRYPGKTEVVVHDYVDAAVPVLNAQYNRRRAGYRQLGFTTT